MPCQPLRLPAALILAGLLAVPAAGIEVAGRVIDYRSGAPLEDTRVSLRCPDGQQGSATAVTDDNGQFVLKSGFQGRCRIEVTKPGYASSVLFAQIEGDLPVVLRMIKGGVIAGRVTGESGAPAPRALIVVMRRIGTGDGRSLTTQTDAQGGYRLFGLMPGSYAVGVVSAMDAMPSSTSGPVLAAAAAPRFLAITAGEEHTNVDFTLPSTGAGSIDGRVEGAPAEDAVLLSLLPRDLPAAPLAKALMDREGRFHFRGLPAGAYSLIAAAPSSSIASGGYAGFLGPNPVFDRVELEVSAESSLEIRINMQPGKTASFQLTGRDKTPASACSPSGTLLLTSLEAWGAQADRQAEISASAPLTLRDLAPVRYAASVTGLHDGCFSSSETVVDLTGDVPSVIFLQVSPGSNLRGKLVASGPSGGGRPVILLLPNPGDFQSAAVLVVQSDASGNFTADSLQPGLYGLLAVGEEDWSDPHWQPDLSAAVEVQLLGGTASVEIPMPARRPGP
jgi:hypothetical protein